MTFKTQKRRTLPALRTNAMPTALPRLSLANGTVESLKWLGLALMTGDHVNKYLFNATLPGLFEVGRLCLPIFVFVLAYNLARPGAFDRSAYVRTMKRLALFGVIASVPYIALGGPTSGWYPLNVLFTLLIITATTYLIEKGGTKSLTAASIVFLVGGSSVEYWWPAIALALGLAVWSYCKEPSIIAAVAALLSCAALWFINGTGGPWRLCPWF